MKLEAYKKYYRITTNDKHLRIERNYPRWFTGKDNWKVDSGVFISDKIGLRAAKTGIVKRMQERGLTANETDVWIPIGNRFTKT